MDLLVYGMSDVGRHRKHNEDTLLMRQVQVRSPGVLQLGEIFWFAAQVPAQWAEASRALGFRTIDAMDPTTRADMATLSPEMGALPCGPRKCKRQRPLRGPVALTLTIRSAARILLSTHR